MMELYLVSDTNLFLECLPLELLPWAELNADPVVIVLTKPILDEIDKHKNASGRTRERAIEIYKRIRKMLDSSATEATICDSGPKVVLRVAAAVSPKPELGTKLDFGKTDEKLLGILAALNEGQKGEEVVLFTDDTGPAAYANALGLPFKLIPSDWRRPNKDSDEVKKIRALEKDVETYRSQEPKILIRRCEPADEAGFVTVTARICKPLLPAEIEEALAALRLKHPIQTTFTPPDGFCAPLEDEVQTYHEKLYPGWMERCRSVLASLHVDMDEVAPTIVLQWSMFNEGSRPASHVRVVFEAQGPLKIRRPSNDSERESQPEAEEAVSTGRHPPILPTPPAPPTFKKIAVPVTTADIQAPKQRLVGLVRLDAVNTARGLLGPVASVNRIFGHQRESFGLLAALGRSGVTHGFLEQPEIPSFKLPRIPLDRRHEEEAFYFARWPSKFPVKRGALTCDLWRHQTGEESFKFEVIFEEDEGPARGSVLCTVHAENLTSPVSSRVKIVRNVEEFRPLELMKKLIESCV